MAGRGRGRGGGINKILVDQLSLQKSELVKETTSFSPETFPPLQFQPAKNPEERSLDKTYMLMVKKEIREHFRNSEYFIKLENKKTDVERYSDRFHCLSSKPSLHLDFSRFPKELCLKGEVVNSRKKLTVKPNIKCAKSSSKEVKDIDMGEKFKELELKEGEDSEKMEEDKEETFVEEDDEDVDEEMDEGTDYINSYFDNGEAFDDDEGDALEEGGYF